MLATFGSLPWWSPANVNVATTATIVCSFCRISHRLRCCHDPLSVLLGETPFLLLVSCVQYTRRTAYLLDAHPWETDIRTYGPVNLASLPLSLSAIFIISCLYSIHYPHFSKSAILIVTCLAACPSNAISISSCLCDFHPHCLASLLLTSPSYFISVAAVLVVPHL